MIQWSYADCVTFCRSRDEFGGLSNMAGGYPIILGDIHVRTTEHLYQALRFPDDPTLQQAIFAVPSALFAKKLAYQHLAVARPDWHEVKMDIMEWCLELKFTQHHAAIGDLLLATGTRDIVEASPRDDYWGAKPDGERLVGWNMLGRLWWRMRRKSATKAAFDLRSAVIEIPNFRLAGADAIELAIANRYV